MAGRRHECIAAIGASMLAAVVVFGVRSATAQTQSLVLTEQEPPNSADFLHVKLFPASFSAQSRKTTRRIPRRSR